MAESGAYIDDVNSLVNLTSTIEHSGEVMSNIDQSVIAHINDVKNTLQRQLDFLQQRYDEAQARYREAESACNACHATQVFVPELGVVPSCAMEEMSAESARMEMENWRMKYERGQQIFGECQREITEYNGPNGAHSLIQKMSRQQTPEASKILRERIARLQDILDCNVVLSNNTAGDNVPNQAAQAHSIEKSGVDLKKKFRL